MSENPGKETPQAHLPNRRQLRVKAMQACYAAIAGESKPQEAFGHLLLDTHKKLVAAGSQNPEHLDDAQFLKDLFYGTMEHKDAYEALVAQKLEKWDIHRTALIDRILILMGIFELLNFAEVPVKVSINEYIEIAKGYSTDKSAVFVNGVLDAIQKELRAENKIRKVGRGLIENP
ncbi:MAG: transcription antitermination factor NusB [Bacteroidetes bacterium]|nr:transcription antitermination factor NusB [Bacteroidota bacterium]